MSGRERAPLAKRYSISVEVIRCGRGFRYLGRPRLGSWVGGIGRGNNCVAVLSPSIEVDFRSAKAESTSNCCGVI